MKFFWNVPLNNTVTLLEGKFTLHWYGITISKNIGFGFLVRRKV